MRTSGEGKNVFFLRKNVFPLPRTLTPFSKNGDFLRGGLTSPSPPPSAAETSAPVCRGGCSLRSRLALIGRASAIVFVKFCKLKSQIFQLPAPIDGGGSTELHTVGAPPPTSWMTHSRKRGLLQNTEFKYTRCVKREANSRRDTPVPTFRPCAPPAGSAQSPRCRRFGSCAPPTGSAQSPATPCYGAPEGAGRARSPPCEKAPFFLKKG